MNECLHDSTLYVVESFLFLRTNEIGRTDAELDQNFYFMFFFFKF